MVQETAGEPVRFYYPQRCEQWFRARLGRVTSTRLKIVADGTLAAQTKLLELMEWECERPEEALKKHMEGFGYRTPAAIKLGREKEDWLVARYEIQRQKDWGHAPKMDRPGLVVHGVIHEFASSPDWIEETADGRTGEGKIRASHERHEYALKHGLFPDDKDQCYAHMLCAGVDVSDYVSYCPSYPDTDNNLVIIEVERDQSYTNFLYSELDRFLKHFRAGTRPTAPATDPGIPSFFDDD